MDGGAVREEAVVGRDLWEHGGWEAPESKGSVGPLGVPRPWAQRLKMSEAEGTSEMTWPDPLSRLGMTGPGSKRDLPRSHRWSLVNTQDEHPYLRLWLRPPHPRLGPPTSLPSAKAEARAKV